MSESTPIISPWLFYWIETANTLKCVFGIIAFIFGIISVFLLVQAIDERTRLPKSLFIYSLCFSIFLLLAVFTPSKNTIYTMTVAEFVTTDNIEILYETTGGTAEDILNGASDFVKDIIDYSVDKVIEAKEEAK